MNIDDLFRLAGQLFRNGQAEQAERLYRLVLVCAPENGNAYMCLGVTQRAQGRSAQAVTSQRRAVRVQPMSGAAHYNLGNASYAAGLYRESAAAYRQAIACTPDGVMEYHNLGNALQTLLRNDEAIGVYRHAVALDPNEARARVNLGGLLMLKGDLRTGAALLEARYRMPDFPVAERIFPQPAWDGGPLDGRVLLAYGERDFGDSIQYIRYVHDLVRRGDRVVVECQPELLRLFTASFPGVPVIAAGSELPHFDCHARLPSLPHLFGTELHSVPGDAPYLRAPEAPPLDNDAGGDEANGNKAKVLRVGIAWAARAQSRTVDLRSCPLPLLTKALSRPGVRLYSLQVGERGADLAAVPDLDLVDLGSRVRDFTDTAGFMAKLDLVVTVDTAVAHLAGALGRPVWTMLSFQPAYRWMLQRSDTPWYPTMSLFRQPRPDDWQSVIAWVSEALQQRITTQAAPP